MRKWAAFFLGSCFWLACADLGVAKLQVASLGTVLTDLAEQVGGPHVEVTPILSPGVDPHLFEPTPGDVRKMADADLVLANGLGFEPYLGKLRQSLGAQVEVLVVGDFIEAPIPGQSCGLEHGGADDHGHQHEEFDPHWWHSIHNAIVASRLLRDAFSAKDPGNADAYATNSNRLLESLEALEKWVRVELASLPREKRVLVTSHQALGYFARDYHFEILPVYGVSTSEQPSSRKVRNLIDSIRSRRVNAIFAESSENPRVLEEIIRETGAKLGGTLYVDGLGDREAKTYDAMMRHNVTTIVEGLR